jgi:regulator of protease activity HflC (stomatin/prohibitin superfamily)
MDYTGYYFAGAIILVFVFLIIVAKGFYQIQPYQQGVMTFLGS